MINVTLSDLQASVQDRQAFHELNDYITLCRTYLEYLADTRPILGYTVALSKLDGIYYVDPRPEMTRNERLREQIADFQRFLIRDMWILSR